MSKRSTHINQYIDYDYRNQLDAESEKFLSDFTSSYYFGIDQKTKETRTEEETETIRESWSRMNSARRDLMNVSMRKEIIKPGNVQELNPKKLKG